MRDRFPGFYRPSDEGFEAFFSDGLVCVDANVLLSLYRVSDATREDVFSIFTALEERLWLPHQVVLEFQRNRRAVIREQEEVYDQLEKELKSFPSRLTEKVRRHHPRIDREELDTVVRSAVAEIEAHLEGLRAAHPEPLSSDDALGADVVRDRLEEIIDGRIGQPLDLGEVEREGKVRYAKRIPPGYADADKGEERKYGDLVVWLELLAEARKHGGPTLLVTDDAKEDWWMEDGGQTVSPRPELVQEMRDVAGSDFWMYRFDSFLARAAEHFEIELGAAARAEVTEAQEPQPSSEALRVWAPYIASGAIGEHREPPDLSNLLVLDPAHHQEIQKTWWMPYRVNAEVQGDLVKIRATHPLGIGRVWARCTVRDPDGRISAVTVAWLNQVEVTYPSDFGGVDRLTPGVYRYTWMEERGPESDAWVEIGGGEFAVPE